MPRTGDGAGHEVWQVKDSNLRRRKPTDLQSAPIGRSGNLPCCTLPRILGPGTGDNETKG